MKKNILLLLLVCFVVFSCTKDHTPGGNPANKTYKVSYKVGGSTALTTTSTGKLKVNGLKSNSVMVDTSYLKLLYYTVFDSKKTVVHFLKQDSTTTNFGNISDSLANGTYTVAIAAGKRNLAYDADDNYIFYPGNLWDDTFYDKFELTVAGSDVDQNVTLSRIVAQLQLKFTDVLPANASYITVTIKNEDYYYSLYSGTPLNTNPNPAALTYKTIIPGAAIGTTDYTINHIIDNTATPFTVIVTCYNSSNKSIGSITVNNVTCEKNKKTILSGKLFGSANGFTVFVNGSWDATPITVNF